MKQMRPSIFAQYGSYSLELPPGHYFIQCWGASGGNLTIESSNGSYASGYIKLSKATQLFLYVGEKGYPKNQSRTFNGGGGAAYIPHPTHHSKFSYSSSGGGASDVRLIGGSWDNFESLKSRIIVAGGGGGGTNFNQSIPVPFAGGNGGELSGENGHYAKCSGCQSPVYRDAEGGQQTRGGLKGGGNLAWGNDGAFGIGGSAKIASINNWPSSGGGGGYFGGASGGVSDAALGTGAGGSSFISGMINCSAISSISTKSSISFNGSVHYSGLFFSSPKMKSGSVDMPSPSRKSETVHSGHGAIIIYRVIWSTKNGSFILLKIPFYIMIALSSSNAV